MAKSKTPDAEDAPTLIESGPKRPTRRQAARDQPPGPRPALGTILSNRKSSFNSKIAYHRPATTDQLDTFTERNLAMVPLTSIQSRIPEKFVNWEITSERDGKEVIFKCVVPAGYGGVPHGLDGDLERALIELYRAAGMPDDGVFTVTPTALLRAAGWPEVGKYYRTLQQGLQRFKVATYTYEGAWYRQDDPESDGRYTSLSFSLISSLAFDGHKDTEGVSLFEGSQITVGLDRNIVRSLLSQNLMPYDLIFMRSISRDTARNLYRLLEGRRHQEVLSQPPGTPFPRTLTVSLMAWSIQCRIYAERASIIRRMLDPIHVELIEHAYLESVTYAGRGENALITYSFAASSTEPNYSELQRNALTWLLTLGFTTPNAASLIKTYDAKLLEETQAKYKLITDGGYRPRTKQGFVTDMLKVPEKYASDDGRTIDVPAQGTIRMLTPAATRVATEDSPDVIAARFEEQGKTPVGLAGRIWANAIMFNMHAQKGERLGKTDHEALLTFASEKPEQVEGLWRMLEGAAKPGAGVETTRAARELIRSVTRR